MYFRCDSRRMLLRSERAFGVSIDRDYSSRAWHLEPEVCIVRHRIELGKCGSPEQCVIATAEGDDIEDQLFTLEVVRGSEDHLLCD